MPINEPTMLPAILSFEVLRVVVEVESEFGVEMASFIGVLSKNHHYKIRHASVNDLLKCQERKHGTHRRTAHNAHSSVPR